MEPWTVLIVDYSAEFRETLAKTLSSHFQVQSCGRGDEALAILTRRLPDLLILDLDLPGLDGISLLRSLPQRPPVLVVSDLVNPITYQLLLELEVDYAIRKPSPLRNVADRAYDLVRAARKPQEPSCLRRGLIRIGLPSEKRGFHHLLTGLPLLANNRDQQLSKELYDTIALLDNSTPAAVEKAIRETLRRGWEEGNRQEWERFFPGITHCPRSREFLFRMADVLRDQLLCG